PRARGDAGRDRPGRRALHPRRPPGVRRGVVTRAARAIDAAPGPALVEALVDAGLEPQSAARRLAEYADDASSFRLPPAAVLFPRSEEAVARALSVCHRLGVPATARGGGTSMAGNAVGTGLVLDLSRHLHRVLDVDTGADRKSVG